MASSHVAGVATDSSPQCVDHGLYLGRKVFRLASSLESGTHYEQDKIT